MMIKNLSKSDYYKSRNIPLPKPVHKLQPQPSVRTHLLQPIATLAVQIKRHIQSKKFIENKELQHLGYEQTLHELQVKIQDLNRSIATKQDEFIGLNGQRQKEIRRIGYLEKQVFDMQSQLQKVEYEYKSTIEFIKGESLTMKSEYIQKIYFLEQQLRRQKEEHQSQIRINRQSYEFKMQSISGNKDAFKNVSEQLMSSLKKNIDLYIAQNRRLKHQLILNQNGCIQKLRGLQEQNFSLKDKIQQNELDQTLSVVKMNAQLDIRSKKIHELSQQISEITRMFTSQKFTLQKEKQTLQKRKLERESKFKENIQELTQQRQTAEQQTSRLVQEMNWLKDKSLEEEKRITEISRKLTSIRIQQQQSQQEHKCTIQALVEKYNTDLATERSALKRQYQHEIQAIYVQVQDKNIELLSAKQKNSKLIFQMQEKNGLIRSLRQSEQTCKIELDQIKQVYEKRIKELGKTKMQMQRVRALQQDQQIQLINSLKRQKALEIQENIHKFTILVANLKQEIRQIKTTNQNESETFKLQLERKHVECQHIKQANLSLNHEKQQIQTKFQSLTSLYEKQQVQHKKYVLQLKRVIQDQAQALKKNTENIEKMKSQYEKIKCQLEQKELQAEKLNKQVKKSHLEQDQLKIQSIRRCSELQELMRTNVNAAEKQKNEILNHLKKAEGQIRNLNSKLQHVTFVLTNIESERSIYLVENQKLKQAYAQKQQTANNLLSQLNAERQIITEKISQDFNHQIKLIQQKNQALIRQINTLKQSNSELLQHHYKTEIQIQELKNRICQKDRQIQYWNQSQTQRNREIKIYQQKIIGLCSKMSLVEAEKKKTEAENKVLSERVSKFEQNMMEMKKSNIYESDLMQDIKSRNNRLLILNQEQRMEIQFQNCEKQNLKNVLSQVEKDLQITKNQLIQLKQNAVRAKTKQEEEQFLIRVRQIKQEYERKNRELFDKIILIEEKISLKEQHMAQSRKLILEKDEIIKQFQGKEAQFKKNCEELFRYQKVTAQLIGQFQKCKQDLAQREQQIQILTYKGKQFELKSMAHIKEAQLICIELESSLTNTNKKLDAEIKKNQEIKLNFQVKLSHHKEESLILNEQINELKNKLRQNEQIKDQIKMDLKRQYEQNLNKFQTQKNQAITNIIEEKEKIIRDLKKEISDLNEQKIKVKNQFYSYKLKAEEDIVLGQNQLLNLQQTINKLKRTSEYLFEYKKRWDKISGQVKEYENIDSLEIKQIDLSFTESIKSSIIIERPFFPKFDLKQGPFGHPKNFLEIPETADKQKTGKMSRYRYDEIDKYQ